MKETFDIADGVLWIENDFLTPAESAMFQRELQTSTSWRQDQIKLFGKTVTIPRLQAFIGDEGIHYRYSGLTLFTSPWGSATARIRDKLFEYTDTEFNAALLNLYRNGQDSMGWHSDDEKELGQNPIIASVSLGAERRFLLRHRSTGAKITIQLKSGSLLWMAGPLQHHWQHSLPKTRAECGSRINLTFRQFPDPSPISN